MNDVRKIVSVFLFAWASANVFAAETSQPVKARLDAGSPTHVLFVGNSYLYYNDSLHNHVSRLVQAHDESLGEQLEYKSATIGGAALDHHPLDSHLTPGRLGVDEPFQVVILQGGSGEPLSDRRRERFLQTARGHNDKIRARGGETALYMTHAYRPPHRRYDPEMIHDIESLYVTTANEIDALVIPVGLAFEEAYRQRPDIVLHKHFDGSHPDILGTYLAACTVFVSLYDANCSGNSYTYFGEVSESDAQFLQGIADDTVRNFLNRLPEH